MGKRLIALGFIMLVVGSILLGWGLYVQRTERQIIETIKIRLDKLEEVKTDEGNIRALADVFTSNDWKQKLETYNSKRESRELLVNTSAVFIFAAGIILTAWLFVWLFGMVHNLIFKKQRDLPEKKEVQKVVIIAPENKDPADAKERTGKSRPAEPEHLKILEKAGWHDLKTTGIEGSHATNSRDTTGHTIKSFADALNNTPQSLELLFSDERASESKKRFKIRSEKHNVNKKAYDFRQGDDSARFEKVLDEQNVKMEEQVSEFRQMAETVKLAAERSEPMGSFIKDLTQQVSAIRDYALTQQERIKKLQDGYDWNIIKTFGLRVIRCIDNLDDRIERLKHGGEDIEDLVEIREEMIFSLESSGIEQYEPEVDSDYNGQEKIAEAVKERQSTDNSEMKGKIAAVLKAGYRYFIDDENYKVVRAARVKLYG